MSPATTTGKRENAVSGYGFVVSGWGRGGRKSPASGYVALVAGGGAFPGSMLDSAGQNGVNCGHSGLVQQPRDGIA